VVFISRKNNLNIKLAPLLNLWVRSPVAVGGGIGSVSDILQTQKDRQGELP
jgi:hypothetical protein